MSPALLAYRALTAAASPFAPGLLRARARRGKEDPARLDERLARAPVRRPPGRLVWLHGASVGEALSLLALAEVLRDGATAPALLMTAGTVTADHLLQRRAPQGVERRFSPLDTPGAARRAVDSRPAAEAGLSPHDRADFHRTSTASGRHDRFAAENVS